MTAGGSDWVCLWGGVLREFPLADARVESLADRIVNRNSREKASILLRFMVRYGLCSVAYAIFKVFPGVSRLFRLTMRSARLSTPRVSERKFT